MTLRWELTEVETGTRVNLSAVVAGDEFFSTVKRGFVAPWTEAIHHQNETVLDTFRDATGLPEVHYLVLLAPG
jgi:hypothetical protein